MNKFTFIISSFSKSFFRDKGILALIVVLPLILISFASAGALEGDFVLEFDAIHASFKAVSLLVVLYSVTAIVFVSSISSFFISFNIKHLIPRLQNVGYSYIHISIGFITIILSINLFITVFVFLYIDYLIDILDPIGLFIGFFVSSFIYSILGLIIAELVNTKMLGIYLILTIGMLDTAFLENPVFSRRYGEAWIGLMPGNQPIKMAIRSIFDTGVFWYDDCIFVLVYLLALIVIYIIIRSKILVSR